MGDNIYLGDRNAVRTPMQWNSDRNAGFSSANPQRLYLPGHHRPRVPLPGGQRRGPAAEPDLAAVVDEAAHRPAPAPQGLRPRHARGPAPGQPQGVRLHPPLRGRAHPVRVQPLPPRAVRRARPVGVPRRDPDRAVRQHLRFPAVGELPYFVTLGPHGFYWFSLEREPAEAAPQAPVASRCRASGTTSSAGRPGASSRRSCLRTWPSAAGSGTRAARSPRRPCSSRSPSRPPFGQGLRRRAPLGHRWRSSSSSRSSSTTGSPERYLLALCLRSPAPRPRS